jgi:hypothetical protein
MMPRNMEQAMSSGLRGGQPNAAALSTGRRRSETSTRNGALGAEGGRQLSSLSGVEGRGAIGRPSSFANPRQVSAPRAGMSPRFSASKPGALSYRAGATNVPREGRIGVGRPGIVDPGGYVRTPGNGSRALSRNYMGQRLSSMSNYNQNFNGNNRFRNTNYSQWPGGWNPGQYGANLGYYPGYWYNGMNYPFNYFALSGFCPTPWLFFLNSGCFYEPGFGYANTLPYGYNQPITIAVNEVVPSYDAFGNIIGYNTETFDYNAFWDPSAQAYGYYDYRGIFHWTTFPWLNTWIG